VKLKFFGATGEVTGSKSMLSIGQEKYFIDYGLYQGNSKARQKNWEEKDFSDVNAVFLTHAHIDHSGLLPRLAKSNFNGVIYCTTATYQLCRILLEDSAHIHQEDAKYINKKGFSRHKPAQPLYSTEDAHQILSQFKVVRFNEWVKISDLIEIKFHWAGHILGSSFIEVKGNDDDGEKTIVFSGDIGHPRGIALKGPENLVECDYLVLESTYGDKIHPRLESKEMLKLHLNSILLRKGVAIIPAFSVGRTQDILILINQLILEKKIPDVPVVLDSPLSKKANKIFLVNKNTKYIKDHVKSLNNGKVFPEKLRLVQTVQESISINSMSGPMIIVSASGMLDGGRVVHHLKKRVSEKENGIILVGYQPIGTKGRYLLDGYKMLRLHKQEFKVNASIFYINSLSAHGDYLDMMEWIKKSKVKPYLTILNHGEQRPTRHLKDVLNSCLGMNVTIAKNEEEFYLPSIKGNNK